MRQIHFLRTVKPAALGNVVLLRLDFNTEDEWRMEAALPTIRLLRKWNKRILIVSHRGRPSGRNMALSLKHDARALGRYLGTSVGFIPDFHFKEIRKVLTKANPGAVFLLENIRFLAGEETNSTVLAKQLAALADSYVNDAFAVSHRADASIEAITKYLPSFAGLEMEKEIRNLSHILGKPKRPLVVFLGGGKSHDKLGILKYFKNKADAFLLGGAPANTMLLLRGVDVKHSLVDTENTDMKMLKTILKYKNLVLPVDYRFSKNAILDIGPKSAKRFAEIASRAATIVWSGPMGYFEKRGFENGNLAVARAIAKNRHAFSVVGGGETVMFLKKYGLDKKFSFVSTGGGAMLDFLAGEKLPGLTALSHSYIRTNS